MLNSLLLLKVEFELPSEKIFSSNDAKLFSNSDRAKGKMLIFSLNLLIEIFLLNVLVFEVEGSKEKIS